MKFMKGMQCGQECKYITYNKQPTFRTIPESLTAERRIVGLKILQISKKLRRTCSTAEQFWHEDS